MSEFNGRQLFEGITAANALAALREMLEALEVPNAASYRTHDFRRGHALDLQLSGALVFSLRVFCVLWLLLCRGPVVADLSGG